MVYIIYGKYYYRYNNNNNNNYYYFTLGTPFPREPKINLNKIK